MGEFWSDVQLLASVARIQRLTGDHHHGVHSQFPLVGYCFDNAYVASHLFTENGFSVQVIEGTTERVAETLISNGLTPRQFESVTELAGHVHYWLTVQRGNNSAIVDIASDSYETLGECLVTQPLPDDYIELPDSRTEGNQTMQLAERQGTRCQFCGDHQYTHGGCPACADTLSADMA
jgi:hypothetical protein